MLLTRTPHLKFGDGEKARSAPFLSEEFCCHQSHGGSLHLPCAVTRDVGPAARTRRTFRFLSFLSPAVFSECPPIDLREMSARHRCPSLASYLALCFGDKSLTGTCWVVGKGKWTLRQRLLLPVGTGHSSSRPPQVLCGFQDLWFMLPVLYAAAQRLAA